MTAVVECPHAVIPNGTIGASHALEVVELAEGLVRRRLACTHRHNGAQRVVAHLVVGTRLGLNQTHHGRLLRRQQAVSTYCSYCFHLALTRNL